MATIHIRINWVRIVQSYKHCWVVIRIDQIKSTKKNKEAIASGFKNTSNILGSKGRHKIDKIPFLWQEIPTLKHTHEQVKKSPDVNSCDPLPLHRFRPAMN